MRLWQKLLALLLALAWMPMVHSCAIVHALGLELPPAHESSVPHLPGDTCDHCAFCETIDAGVALSSSRVSVPRLTILLSASQPVPPVVVEQSPRAIPDEAAIIRGDPGGPPRRWQFVERAAPSPRAPSPFA